MKTIALIPARYASTRLPGKLMQKLDDQSVIWHTYANVLATGLFDKVYVVTDHEIIYQEINSKGGNVLMSDAHFECGTDRIASIIPQIEDADIYINVQGDEPFTAKEPLHLLIQAFAQDIDKNIGVCTLRQRITDETVINNPNVVKVITTQDDTAIYFSRLPIPYNRDNNPDVQYFKHIGIYAFRKQALLDFAQLPVSPLENIEKLENLRFIENNIKVKALVTDYINVGIDTPEDLIKAQAVLLQRNK